MAITAATPITMPSMVRNERSLFARSASRATARVSTIGMLAPPAAAGSTASPSASARHAGHSRSHALPEAALILFPLGLRLRHAEKRDLFALAQAVQHLGIVEVAEPEPHHSGLEPIRGLDEDNFRPPRPPDPRPLFKPR